MGKLAHWLLWLSAAALCALLLPVIGNNSPRDVVSPARLDVLALVMALRNYRDEYGELPAGAALDIIKALRGNNPRRIVFIDFRDKQFDAAGRLLDPWGSPYRIDVSDPDHPRVYSPGKNKRAEPGVAPSDDVCSWR